MKLCVKCGKVKHESAYYKHPTSADKLQSMCKECNKADALQRSRKKPNGKRYADRIMKELRLEE